MNSKISFLQSNKNILPLVVLFCILLLSFHIRSNWIGYIELHSNIGKSIGYDGVRYDWIATNLLNNEGFGYYPNTPNSWRPPGYPFLLYAVYSLLGHSIHAIRILQCLFGTIICLILFLISKKIIPQRKIATAVGLTSAFLYSLSHLSIIINQYLFTELFSSALTITSIYFFLCANSKSKIKFYIFASLAAFTLWYAVLTRPANLIFWFWVGLWFVLENRNNWQRILKAFLITIIFFITTIFPWTLRNYYLHKKFLLISSNGGFIFHMAHNPHSVGGFIPDALLYTPEQKDTLSTLDEIDRQKKHFQFGREWIKNNPKRERELILLKQKRLWGKIENKNIFFDFLPNTKVPLLTFHFFLFCSIPGIYYVICNFRAFSLPLFYIFNHALIISLIYFYDGQRMRIALLPILAIIAAIGLVNAFNLMLKFTKKLR